MANLSDLVLTFPGRTFGIGAVLAWTAAVGCSGNETAVASSGGSNGMETGGGPPGSTGGSLPQGGEANVGGSLSNTGGSSSTGTSVSFGGTFATGGAAAGGNANTGGAPYTGGSSSPGGASAKPTGGAPTSTGGSPATGGAKNTGGTSAAGGSKNTGGSLATGGSVATGGSSSSSGGRGAGICPGGTYPTPTVTGTPTRIYNSSASGLFEGTVWLSSASVLLFSNMSTSSSNPVVPSQVQRLTPPSTVDVLLADSGTNGMALDANGLLVACSHKVQGLVSINTATSAITTLVSTDSNGKHFNSPNDLTVRTDGTIYFTDPDYQLGSSRTSETGIKGVYRVSPSRQVSLVDGTFGEPNGIALSPDESALYVADMNANAIRKFTVAADGTTSGKTTFASVTNPDGVTVDCAGNVYWASNSGAKVIILSPSGSQIGSITVAANLTNLAFGGADHKTLYMSVGTAIYSLPMNVPGFPY